jgi:hypothetical protein
MRVKLKKEKGKKKNKERKSEKETKIPRVLQRNILEQQDSQV